MGEELANIVETELFVFLKQSCGVGHGLLFDEGRKVARLGVVDFKLWLDLADSVKRVHLANRNLHLVVLLPDDTTEEIVVGRWHFLIEHRCVVHVVLQNSETLVLGKLDLSQEFKLLHASLKDQFSVWSNMPAGHIFALIVQELLFGWHFVSKVVSTQSARHAKVVDKEGVLVNVLKNAELTLVER